MFRQTKARIQTCDQGWSRWLCTWPAVTVRSGQTRAHSGPPDGYVRHDELSSMTGKPVDLLPRTLVDGIELGIALPVYPQLGAVLARVDVIQMALASIHMPEY